MSEREPPISPECDLRDFSYTPMYRSRLFGSSFHARVSDAGWRAGVTLWLKSWDQVPAGSLPDDEIDLCRLAELGRDIKTWRKLSDEALWGWEKCNDGRLYHDTVAQGINEAWDRKLAQRNRTNAAREAALRKRLLQDAALSVTDALNDCDRGTRVPDTGSVTESTRLEGKRSKDQSSFHSDSSSDEPDDVKIDLLGKAKRSKPEDTELIQEIAEMWNTEALSMGLAAIRDIKPKRIAAVRNRVKDMQIYGFDDPIVGFRDTLARVRRSPLLTGKAGSWKASFDWLMKSENFTKVMEGNYEAETRVIPFGRR